MQKSLRIDAERHLWVNDAKFVIVSVFPRGGSANSKDGGANLSFGHFFSRIEIVIERNWTERRTRISSPTFHRSTTEVDNNIEAAFGVIGSSDRWSKPVFWKKYPKVVRTIKIQNEVKITEVYTHHFSDTCIDWKFDELLSSAAGIQVRQ